MKRLKMLSLAAVAAMALMSVVGIGSAVATTKLCSTSGTGESCGTGHGNELTANDVIHATLESGTVSKVTSSFDNTSCTESTMHGHLTANTPPKA
jgi:hypothetical protein